LIRVVRASVTSLSCAIGPVQSGEATRDAGVDLLHPPAHLGRRIVLVAIVHRLELAAIDRDNGLGEEVQPTAQLNEPAARCSDRGPVVAAEVGDRLEVRRQAPRQPHQLDVALRFPLKAAARLKPVEVAVKVDLQHRRGVVDP
jgi:hypothetical protein